MKLLCIECGNYTYFTAEVEGLRGITVNDEGLVVQDAIIDDCNWSDSTLRDNLDDIVKFALRQDPDQLQFDLDSRRYHNRYTTCARCGSNEETVPMSKWHPPQTFRTLEEELKTNHKELIEFKKENSYANYLPVLREH